MVVFIFCCLTVYKIPFLCKNLNFSLLESFNKFIIFCVSIFMILTEFCENSKVVFFWIFNDEKHCCFIIFKFTNNINLFFLNQSFLIQFVCFNLLQLICNDLKNIHNPINYQLYNNYFYAFQFFLVSFFFVFYCCIKNTFTATNQNIEAFYFNFWCIIL